MTEESIMTKTQIWDQVQQILTGENVFKSNKSKEEVTQMLSALLKPKVGGGKSKRPADITHNGMVHKYCRFTGNYFPISEMVYQNAAKREAGEDKGYSNIGYSIWNKGQAWKKNAMKLSTEINFGLITEHNELTGDELRQYAIELYKEVNEVTDANSLNDAEYLMANFLSEEQADVMEGLDLPEIA